jgi:hypothetical protein
MSYRVRRIDPYWIVNPVLPVVALASVAAALVLINKEMVAPAIGGALIFSVAVILMTKPAVSAVMGTLGLFAGITTFIVVPNPQNAAMALPFKLLSTAMFTVFYAVLMDGVVLIVAALYNFAGALGLEGLSLDLEDGGSGEA